MKYAIRIVVFHFLCIIIFGLIYLTIKNQFIRDANYSVSRDTRPELIDYLFLATTVQAGVGYSDLYPTTIFSKIILILQQFIMISTNVFLLYFFTL
jgi:hypothetical protein